MTGSGLGLLAGVAFVLTPACSGGGGVHDGVHLTAASSHVRLACAGGGGRGDN